MTLPDELLAEAAGRLAPLEDQMIIDDSPDMFEEPTKPTKPVGTPANPLRKSRRL